MDQIPVTPRTRLRRHPERGHTDRAALHAILDQGLVAHVAFVADGQPFAIPMAYVRLGDALYLHGALANRMLRAAAEGAELCVTVTLLDGLVLARSAFHHSMNYRSAVVFGRGRLVEAPPEKQRVLTALVERLAPGRGSEARVPDARELAVTLVLALPLDEASVKIRTGPPLDDESDLAWPVWAGVIPLGVQAGAPVPDKGATGSAPARTLAGPTPVPAAAAVEVLHAGYAISDDRARIDLARVTSWLEGAYWCPGIPRWAVERAFDRSSLVVGAYSGDGEQVGTLRVVSDGTRFANVMDVFVAPHHRARGLGRAMLRFAMAHPAQRDVPRWMLGTRDAHGVYAREGFGPVEHPERLMQRMAPAPWERP
jgi:uncharacterized protein